MQEEKMKKTLLIVALSVALFPLTASADFIGEGSMSIHASVPEVPVVITSTNPHSSLYGDYDIVDGTDSLPAGLILTSNEVFCVEGATLTPDTSIDYAFYSIDASLNTNYATDDLIYVGLLKEATWLANWGYNSSDKNKATAQAAIWTVLHVETVTSSFDYYEDMINLLDLYNAAENKNQYVNDWLFAASPTTTVNGEIQIGAPGQNFLVRAPVPEPTTMLLFGTGLAGLVGLVRRKRS